MALWIALCCVLAVSRNQWTRSSQLDRLLGRLLLLDGDRLPFDFDHGLMVELSNAREKNGLGGRGHTGA